MTIKFLRTEPSPLADDAALQAYQAGGVEQLQTHLQLAERERRVGLRETQVRDEAAEQARALAEQVATHDQQARICRDLADWAEKLRDADVRLAAREAALAAQQAELAELLAAHRRTQADETRRRAEVADEPTPLAAAAAAAVEARRALAPEPLAEPADVVDMAPVAEPELVDGLPGPAPLVDAFTARRRHLIRTRVAAVVAVDHGTFAIAAVIPRAAYVAALLPAHRRSTGPRGREKTSGRR